MAWGETSHLVKVFRPKKAINKLALVAKIVAFKAKWERNLGVALAVRR
jgi:uncharacterized membrane protein YpjA